MGITHMETRIGRVAHRRVAKLGQRTGSASLQSLAAMLVQAERFRHEHSTGLRVHADSLRVKRQHLAEERAAKTTLKLAFPVVCSSSDGNHGARRTGVHPVSQQRAVRKLENGRK